MTTAKLPRVGAGHKLTLGSKRLADGRFVLLTDSQDVLRAYADTGCINIEPTGALVWAEDGEYREIWITDASKPWANCSEYICCLVA